MKTKMEMRENVNRDVHFFGWVKYIEMQKHFVLLLVFFISFISSTKADTTVNLTPQPKTISVQEGVLTLPDAFVADVRLLGDSVVEELDRFANVLAIATDIKVSKSTTTDDALLQVRLNPEIFNPEGYVLKITTDRILVEASHTSGFFYAFQTILKMLPAHIMAGVKRPDITDLQLPLVQIVDEPRFGYRGFMLDVARHFFDVDEVKRIMDMMACYKMNKLHLHLSDDQGFRVEITKYPRLNFIGSVRDDSYSTDFGGSGIRFHTYKPYGPYYYTKEQIRDLVDYARNLHIDIIPEIDMPGHFGAAMAAYPEFSCEPNMRHPVLTDESHTPTIPNVANPKTIQFAKGILTEIMDLFPYPYIHIGGDECDASHWERNDECVAFMKKMKFSHVRALQSYFTKEMADFVAQRGYKLMAWNETITATGSDLDMIKSTGADIVCWTGAEAAAQKACSLGLSNILAPQPTYYINRKQSSDPAEPTGPGNGNETLEAVYNYAPASNVNADKLSYYKGVQACMWTEYISAEKHLEYMAFPRLMAVAESGWSPANKKNFDDFCRRMRQDTVLFNYRDYEYGRHYLDATSQEMVMPKVSNDEQMFWYRLQTLATDTERSGRCMALLHDGSEAVVDGFGQINMLWSDYPVEQSDADYKYQMWALKESPTEPGKYAIVSQAFPNGSVNPEATNTTTGGRWTYDTDKVHYHFILNDAKYYGQVDGCYYYSIRSDRYTDKWMNLSMKGQNYAINVYNNPADSKAGLWSFVLQTQSYGKAIDDLRRQAESLLKGIQCYEDEILIGKVSGSAYNHLSDLLSQDVSDNEKEQEQYVAELKAGIDAYKASLGMPQDGQQIRITNVLDSKVMIVDHGSNRLATTDAFGEQDIWLVSKVADKDDTFYLKNLNTSRYISGSDSPLLLSADKSEYKIIFDWVNKDFIICAAGDKPLFPISKLSAKNPATIYTDGIRAQGTGWNIERVNQVVYLCCDSTGHVFHTYYQSVPADSCYTYVAPEIVNWKFEKFLSDDIPSDGVLLTGNKEVRVGYKRENCEVTLVCRDQYGHQIKKEIKAYPYQSLIYIEEPEIEYYTFQRSDLDGQTSFVLLQDTVINIDYNTDAYIGYWELGDEVTELQDGHQYLFYNATAVEGRSGFLNVDASGIIKTSVGRLSGLPPYVWTLEASGTAFKLHNMAGLSMPVLNQGKAIQVSEEAGLFSFSKSNGVWQIKDQNGLYWNGNVGSMTGWTDPHPYLIYEFVPYLLFKVTVNYVDPDGKQLLSSKEAFVRAGHGYSPVIAEISGYSFDKISVATDELERVSDNLSVNVVYVSDTSTGIIEVNTNKRNSKTYSLDGREVAEPTRGIYIQKGKKVLIP